MSEIVRYMGIAGRKNETLFKLLEVQFIKHRQQIAFDKEIKENIKIGYSFTKHASKMLFDCLENPNIEVPSLESQHRP